MCQVTPVLQGVLGGHLGFQRGNTEFRVILDVMDQSESFMLTFLLEVCQELPVLDVGTWMMLRVPERRLGGQGLP